MLGPWHHGQEIEPADRLGAIRFGRTLERGSGRTSCAPFLDALPQRRRPRKDVAPVTAYETGVRSNGNTCPRGLTAPATKPLYLESGLKLGFSR